MYRNFTFFIIVILFLSFQNDSFSQGGIIYGATSQLLKGCSASTSTTLNPRATTFAINPGATVDAIVSCPTCAVNNITLSTSCAVNPSCTNIPPGIEVLTVIPTINDGNSPTPLGNYSVTITLTLDAGIWTIAGGQAGTSNGAGVFTLLFDIEVNSEISVSILPTALTVCQGTIETLSANVTAGAPSSYSWAETSNPTTILSTASSLDVISSGTYDVTVTSSDGCAAGNDQDDQIIEANSTPSISNTNCQNFQSGTTIITVNMAEGTNLSYQWQRDGTNISNGGDFSIVNTGDASSVLTISNLNNHYQSTFTCNVSNICGNIISTGCLALPVDLVGFNASKREDDVIINWVTAMEINNAHFAIERAIDGRNFSEIGQVKGAGESHSELSYVFIDDNITDFKGSDLVSYRLKQVDFDGQYKYSEVISIKINDRAEFDIIKIFEEGAQINVQFNNSIEGDVGARVFNLNGQLLQTKSNVGSIGFNELSISTADLRPGLYVIILTNGHKHISQKFIKLE